jgi:hypothetical protein
MAAWSGAAAYRLVRSRHMLGWQGSTGLCHGRMEIQEGCNTTRADVNDGLLARHLEGVCAFPLWATLATASQR